MSGASAPTKQFPSFPSTSGVLPETLNPPHAAGHGRIHSPHSSIHHGHQQGSASEDTSMDMDMPQAPGHSNEFSPTAGRIPTPIQPSFMTQVRGNPWADGPATERDHPNGINNMGHQPTPFPPPAGHTIPRTVGMDDWNAVRNRRLPSPISEGEDSSAPSPDMVLDGSTTHLADRLASQVSITTPGEQRSDPMDQGPHGANQETGQLPGPPTTPSPARKGHTRSRHTIDSWTWQPGMKKSFSMGYRTDCEKCRMKVPGHFNHIVIS